MKEYKFRFYLGKKVWERKFKASNIAEAWKLAKRDADEYPTKRFIEIANIS